MLSQNADEGIPVMRPLVLMFENDRESYKIQYEYMYGDDLLVAPVVDPGFVDWEVYLPGPEGWVYLWDEAQLVIEGPTHVKVPAPIGQPPVFYRANSKWRGLLNSIRENYSL